MKVEPEFQRCWSSPDLPLVCFRGRYLDGKLPHSIFRVFFSVLDADPEGPIGLLFCGPVMYTFLEGRNLGVGMGKFIGEARLGQQRGLVFPPRISPHDSGQCLESDSPKFKLYSVTHPHFGCAQLPRGVCVSGIFPRDVIWDLSAFSAPIDASGLLCMGVVGR